MNKTAIVIILAAVILLGGFFLLRGQTSQTPAPQTAPAVPAEESQAESVPETEADAGEPVAGEEVSVESGNFFFTPNKLSVAQGTVIVKVTKNNGFHTFVIDKLEVNEQLADGATFSFDAPAGTFEYYCDVPGHRERGMFGSLKVQVTSN